MEHLQVLEDEVVVEHGKESYTRPEEVEEFVTRTGCDSLAIAIGTSHGAYKFKASQCTRNADGILVPPPLRFDVLEECTKRLPGFPIVLHGSSSVPQEFVKMVNQYGGNSQMLLVFQRTNFVTQLNCLYVRLISTQISVLL